LKIYQDSLDTIERLAKTRPDDLEMQRDLAVSYSKVGDVLVAQDNLAEALKVYQNCLAITNRLIKADRRNLKWQRDHSLSYERIGDVLQLGDAGQWQGRLGLLEAVEAYIKCKAIRERLAKADPNNAGLQRDLAIPSIRAGDVLVKLGDLGLALDAYQEGFAIRDRLAKINPSNVVWQHDLADAYGGLAKVFDRLDDTQAALSALQGGRAIIVRLSEQFPSDTTLRSYLGWFDSNIANLAQEDTPQAAASPATENSPQPARDPETGWWRKLTSLWR
jgi:tetratricopeptide (TPR) repeat protein